MMNKSLLMMILGGSLVSACIANDREDTATDTAELAVESSDSADAEGNVIMAMMDGTDLTSAAAPLTADQIAGRVAANVALRWNPRACATVVQSGSVLTITLTDCTGPRGLLRVNGQLVVRVSVGLDGSIRIEVTSAELRANDAVLTVDAIATYRVRGTTSELAVETRGSGTGPRGRTIEHDGDYRIEWDAGTQCRRIAGTWSTELGGITRGTTVDMERCVGACPVGTIDRQFRAGGTITLTFDGTATAAWSASTGASGTIALPCGAPGA